MTSFFAILSLSGPQELTPDLTLMIGSVQGSLNDIFFTWNNELIALGQATFRITPESFNEDLPLYQSDSKLAIIGNIRLDNRKEILSKLVIDDPTHIGDAEIILAAYSRWKERCVDHLLGDYSVAIFDGNENKLFCFTDHFAQRGLFHYHDQEKLVISSHPEAIAALPWTSTGPNLDKLSWFTDPSMLNIMADQTWYKNISIMSGAATLRAGVAGVKLSRYWTPEEGRRLTFKNDAEFGEAFREVFFEAVSCRMRSKFPVTALLSGGLDSSSIVSVAAKILEDRNEQLDVFSVVLPDQNDTILKDERYYIDLYKKVPNVRINYLHPPDKGFMSDLNARNYSSSGPGVSSRHYLYREIENCTAELDSRVILDGVGGELGATANGEGFYAELFWTMNWPRLWKELKARKRLAGTPILTMLRSNVIKPFTPDLLYDLLKNKADINVGGMDFFQPDFKKELQKRAEVLKRSSSVKTTRVVPVQRRNQLAKLQLKQIRGHQGYNEKLEFRFPFMDKRMLEFALNSPTDLKIRNGYNRNLIRLGLEGILPSEIQWRTTKNPFSPDYMRRYRQQVPQVKEFLDSIGINDPVRAVIDVEKLKSFADIHVRDDEKDLFKIKIALHELPFAIYTIYYLRGFKDFQN